MRKIGFILSLLAYSIVSWAVPATPYPIVRHLPDGKTDTVYLRGDENYHFYTDLRGHRIAVAGEENEDERTPKAMHAPRKMQMDYSYVPSSGKVRIPVILVNFKDLSFSLANAKEQFDDLFNGSGGSNPNATGSVHNYYIASSDSALDLEYEVFGPYTLSREMAYYGQNRTSGSYTDHNVHARELVLEAAYIAEEAGVDFSQFDNNNDGYIDNVSIVVAGYNEAEGGAANTIWPHYSSLNGSNRYSGKYIGGYLMISEYRSSGGKVQAGIGTYCHEFGHALGLPDLYDTEQSDRYTVGEWDIMCSGSYNNNGSTPPSFTAFERFMLGWLVPEQITTAGMRILEPIESSNKAYLIALKTHNLSPDSPNPTEFFMIENRQKVGWDAGKEALVAPGMLISHINFNQTRWTYNTFNNYSPLGFDIVSAGSNSPTSSSAADVFPGTTRRTSWTPKFYDGSSIDSLTFTQIRQRPDGSVSMQVGGSEETMLRFDKESVEMETSYDNGPVKYDTADAVLYVPAMQREAIRMFVSSRSFRFSPDGGKEWYNYGDTAEIAITPDSAFTIPIKVVFLPSRKNCDYSYAFLSAETTDGEIGTQLTLGGRAPRPTYITTPVIDSVSNLTSTSFTLAWEPQEDADLYYYMLYTVSEGESEEVESFDDFNNLDAIREKGWNANFTNIQSTYAKSGKALLFEKTGEYIESPYYFYAPAAITLWISNNYTPNSVGEETGGTLVLSGSKDGSEWETVSRIYIQRTTRNTIRTIELDSAKEWHQFRLTYTHIGGKGGTAVDEWTAHLNRHIEYIYQLKEYYKSGTSSSIAFRDLQPATTYYYSMQALEEKGCEPHYSALSAPYAVRTPEKEGTPRLKIVRAGTGQYSAILPEPADGKHYIGIYTYTGRLLQQLTPANGTTTVILPHLPEGQVFLAKYYYGKMGRKDLNAKIVSY